MIAPAQCGICGTGISPGPLGDVCPVCLLRDGHSEVLGLDDPGPDRKETQPAPDRAGLPREFGGYELIAEIAHGGMGIVYRARHRVLGREVALKLLLAGAFASPDFVLRFRREAAAAASLQHPGIVGVYEVGEVDGQPFLAMEYVAGKTLAERVRERPLPPREAARYLEAVAEAVEHAHEHGLLHRDLKPSNVLLDLNDQPRVTDFGLAKRLDGTTDLTVTGQMLGSPNYLSPEAALGHEQQLTPASDVYSLGATLYHLLTGRPPLLAGSLAETLVQVREQTAVAPRLLNPAIPRDLETICVRCLEKEPGRRYASARELAADLGRWRRDEPIHARPPGPTERVWKWMRRYPARAALAGTVVFSGAALTAASLWFNLHLTTARNETERNRRLSETNRLAAEASAAASHRQLIRMQVLTGNRLAAEGDPLAAGLWFAEALRQELQAGADAHAEQPHRRRLAGVWGSAPRLVGLYAGSFDFPNVEFTRDGRWLLLGGAPPRLIDLTTGSDAAWFAKAVLGHAVIEFSAAGNRMAELSVDPAHPSRLWRLSGNGATNATLVTLPASVGMLGRFSPDERLFVTGGDSVRFWDPDTGTEARSPLPAGVSAKNLEFSADGRHLLVRSVADSSVRVWNLTTGAPDTPVVPGDYFTALPVLSPDGGAILSSRREGELQMELRTLADPEPPRRTRFDSPLYAQGFHPGGRWLATAHWDGLVRLWSADTLAPLGSPLRHPGGVTTMALSPDGTRLAAGGYGNEVRIWAVPEDRLATSPLRVGAQVSRVAFSPDGRYLLAVIEQRLVRVWDLFAPAPPPLPGVELNLAELAVSPQGIIAGLGNDGRGHLWQPVNEGGRATFEYRVIAANAGTGQGHFEFDAAGQRLATAGLDGQAQVWSVATGELLQQMLHGTNPVARVRFSPDGHGLLTAGRDGLARRWDLATGRELRPPLAHGGVLRDAAFSPDSQRVATGGADGFVRVWDFATGESVGQPLRHDSEVARVAFSPDGRSLLTSTADDGARALYAQLWDADTLAPLGTRMEHTDGVPEARFFPDGRRVATAGEDGLARVWDATTGAPRTQWMRGERRLLRLEISPDGRIVATVEENGRLRLWDADSGEPLSVATPREPVSTVRFLDADRLVFAGGNGPLRLWELPVARGPAADLGSYARLAAGHEIDIAGGLSLLPAKAQLALFEGLHAKRPDDFRLRPFSPEWHRQELARATADQNAFAVEFHRRALERSIGEASPH